MTSSSTPAVSKNSPAIEHIRLNASVSEALSEQRLDQVAAKLFPDYSRARLQAWIKDGQLLVNGEKRRPRDKVAEGDALTIEAQLQAQEHWLAEQLPLDIVYEDEHLLVINKAIDVVVHPAAGHRQGTLLNGLLHHCPELERIPRAGIVHRLDKDTSGLLVVAKTLEAHSSLVEQLLQRSVKREYEAIVNGVLTGGGKVDQPLGRHPVNRKKRAIDLHAGKEAITHYRVIQRFRSHTHIQVNLETGRTHQIRVHMTHLKYPLVGDPMYGGRLNIPKGSSPELTQGLKGFRRQALHARKLALLHPADGEEIEWSVERPSDMANLLTLLEADC